LAQVFISHSNRDNALAAEVRDWLKSRGFEAPFLDFDKDAGIPPGANWERELYRMIDSSQAVILIVTPNWHASRWCFGEFFQARALGKAIFPVVVAPTGERFVTPDIQQLDIQSDREAGLERLARELTRISLDAQGGFDWDSHRPPYPGLLAFERKDAAVFFGRDDDVRRVIERLNVRRSQGGSRFVVLLGASGSGKSSVVRAGLIPRLARDRQSWICLPPFRPGRDPGGEFAKAVSEALGQFQDWRAWRDRLALPDHEPQLQALAEALRVQAQAREAHVLVTIDQAEELFAIVRAEDRELLFRMIYEATAEHMPFVVLMALRSDYLERLQQATGTLPLDQILLTPFPRARVRQIIEGPARVAGIPVDDALVAAAIEDMATDDALPLLAFTLRELYDRAAERRGSATQRLELTLAHYQALGDSAEGLNPLENAVRKRADELLLQLNPSEEELRAVREAFVGGMVRVDEAARYVRRPASWDDLPRPAHPILEKLVSARLLVVRTDQSVRTVEVAHEALLRKWPRLRQWLDEERDFLVGKAQLRYALEGWQRADDAQKDAALLRGLSLSRARVWLDEHAGALTADEKNFIVLSIQRDDLERQSQARRRRAVLVGISGAVILFAALSAVLAFLWNSSDAARRLAQSTNLAILARQALARDPVASAALAARAVALAHSVDAQSILLESVLALSPYLEKVVHVSDLSPNALAWFSDGSTVVAGGSGKLVQWRPSVSEGKTALIDSIIGPQGSSDRLRPETLTLSVAADRVVAVMQNGARVAVDRAGSLKGTDSLQADPIERAAASSDGSVVLVSGGGRISLFRCGEPAAGSAPCNSTNIASGYAKSMAANSVHSVAAVGFEDGTVKIVGFGDAPFAAETNFRDPIVALAWSPDGAYLAAGTTNGRLLVTDARNRLLAEAPATGGSVSALAWSPNSSQLASPCRRYTVCIWNPLRLELTRELIGHTNVVTGLAWSPDGRKLASIGDNTLRLWSNESPDRTSFALNAGAGVALTSINVSTDRRWIGAGDGGGRLHVWNLADLAPQPVVETQHRAAINLLAWSPGASRVATADAEGTIELKDWPDQGRAGVLLAPVDEILAMSWLPDAAHIVTAGGSEGAITIRPADGGRSDTLVPKAEDSVSGLAVTSDGLRLLSVDVSGELWVWDLPARRLLDAPRFNTGMTGNFVALSHDQRRVLAAGNSRRALIYAMDGANVPIQCSSGSKNIDDGSIGPGDKSVYAIGADAVLHIWALSERCDLLVAVPIPANRPANDPAYRHHLVMVPELNALALTVGTGSIRIISLDPDVWLNRAKTVSYADGS
jgi:WD40 repeat protein